jgi:hypothetical protein
MPAKCGTYGGWAEHRRKNEKPCNACREAKNRYNKEWKAGIRRKAPKLSDSELKRRAAAYTKEKRRRQKAIVNAWKSEQAECVDCGLELTERNQVIMHCDHVDPEVKSFTISERCGTTTDAAIRAELEKCVMRCANCHGINSYKQNHHLTDRSETRTTEERLRLFDAG